VRRTILLVDINAFYASVHQALDPSLRGRPVIVGGDPEKRRGIVLAASYEAKAYGVKTGMTVREAARLCPAAVMIRPAHSYYLEFSARILRILKDFTPLVEPFSIDEAFLDLTGCERLLGTPLAIAHRLKARLRQEVGVTCSMGIAPNKLLAKMAAEMQKPDGLTILDYPDIPARIWPLPVRDLFGVGIRTEEKLHGLGIFTIGQLAAYPAELLESKFGVIGLVLHLSARGIDHSPVDPHSLDTAKSIGHQITLPRDYSRHEEIEVVILELAELVARRARQGGYGGRTVTLSLRDNHFDDLIRTCTLTGYTNLPEDIREAAVRLLRKHWPRGARARLVGVSLGGLVQGASLQLDLDGRREKLLRLARSCDYIRDRFGEGSVFRAASLTAAGVIHER